MSHIIMVLIIDLGEGCILSPMRKLGSSDDQFQVFENRANLPELTIERLLHVLECEGRPGCPHPLLGEPQQGPGGGQHWQNS